MCTVTYLPLGNNNFILTSNRDESPIRETFLPKEYKENQVSLWYPKDKVAGGTWIGVSDKKRLVCLLNGAFVKHKRKSTYKLSRGIIVKQILTSRDAIAYITDYDFSDIEPFTVVFVDWTNQLKVYELVWDGKTKHFKNLSQEPKIWSSTTLYTEEIKEQRRIWFADWLNDKTEFKQQEIINFHQTETLGTPKTSIKMKRSFVETVSITSVKKIDDEIYLEYIDFLTGKESKTSVKC